MLSARAALRATAPHSQVVTTLTARRPPAVFFSTAGAAVRSGNGGSPPNSNPSFPAFKLSHITSNPRTRRWLIGGFVVLCGLESTMWYKVGGNMWGKEKDETGGE